MYSRYSPAQNEQYIPATGGMTPLGGYEKDRDHIDRGPTKREKHSPLGSLSGLAGLFGGGSGKNPLGGFVKGLRRRDGGELDLGDIVLLLILLFLFLEDGSNDFYIILIAILILGI